MLLLLYLLHHSEIDTAKAAEICQRSEGAIRERLAAMEKTGYIEHGGAGRGAYWSINPALYRKLSDTKDADMRRRIDWDAAKTRILSVLKERAKHGEPGLSNAEIRHITKYGRNHAYQLITELREENAEIEMINKNKKALYVYKR